MKEQGNTMSQEASPLSGNTPTLYIAFAVVLAVAFDYLFIWKLPGLSAPVMTIAVGVSLVSISRVLKRKLPFDVAWLLGLAVFFSAMVAVRSNPLLTALNIVATLLLLMLITEVNGRGSLKEFATFDYLKIIVLPIAYLVSLIAVATSARFPFSESVGTQSKQILRGILITLPVVILFSVLFAGADPMFNTLLSKIVGIHFVSLEQPFVILAVAAFACGALGYSFSGEPSPERTRAILKRSMGQIETSILLGSVNALFAIFIGLQATYFFGGALNIGGDAFTYAEYARRGFFELIAISAFTYLIALAAEKLMGGDAEHSSTTFRYLSTALVAQVAALMIFAFNRLILYESAFGFTTLRLYSHAFILLLAVIYMFLLYKIHVDARENAFALRTFFAVVVFVASMNILNPDAFIAQRNWERFGATGKIDYEYLARLSSDATPVLIAIFERGDAAERSPLGRAFYDRSVAVPGLWQSWNLSRANERALLDRRSTVLEPYAAYQKE